MIAMAESAFQREESQSATTLYDDLVRAVQLYPDRVAVVGVRQDTAEPTSMTYRELKDAVDRFSGGLEQLGVQKGDVVSVQLPNLIEFPVVVYAVFKLGAVFNGITSIFRQREVDFILRRTESKVYIIPSTFRGFDHLAMARELKVRIPSLQTIVTVDEITEDTPGVVTMKELSRDSCPVSDVQPEGLAQIAFTSGTTGEPKGVMQTHRILRSTVVRFVEHVNPPTTFVNLIVSPVGHQTGFLWGTVLSVYLGGTAVYLDVWNSARAWATIRREGVTAMVAAAPFLRDLVETVKESGVEDHTLSMICIPGAPIPRSLVPQAVKCLGCRIVPAWGMTEYGIGIGVGASDPEEAYGSDGRALPGAALRVVDTEGSELPAGEEGDLQLRGEGLFTGYYKRPDLTADNFSGEWFKTGDRAVMNEAGFIKLTGRSKDIVVRGGENVPVQDIENVLFQWPMIQDVAIVAMPDLRLGERACAYVVPNPQQQPTLEKMQQYLSGQQLTKQFWPERLECVDEFPRTASGKVQKYALREDIRQKCEMEGQSVG